MRKKTKRNIFLIFFATIGAIAILGYCIWNKPHLNVKNATAIKTTAISLYSSLSKNDTISKSIYLNKVVEVSGEITQISLNQQHQQIILLKTNVSGGSVNCTMEEKVNNIKAGDSIVLKGICGGYIGGDMDMGLPGDVFLTRCYPSS
ncbi:MAG: hypothetical protein ABI185_07130 [Ginsengibacter sp.]